MLNAVFNEASPKQGHWLTLVAGVAAGLAMLATAFDAWLWYAPAGDASRVVYSVPTAPVPAFLSGIIAVPLVVFWHRGAIGAHWPLLLVAAVSLYLLLSCAGIWWEARSLVADGHDVTVSWGLPVATAAAVVGALAALAPLVFGVREVSAIDPTSWTSRRRARPR